MTIYIDNEFKCYATYQEGFEAVETPYFDDMCAEFIEGHRFIPYNSTWTREDGKAFRGEMAAPWKPYKELAIAQINYERAQLSSMKEEQAAQIEAYYQGVQEA